MTFITQIIYLLAGVGFAVAAFIILVRVITGPTILDRMVASDVLVTTLILVTGAEMAFNRHESSIVFMTLLAATSAFATVMVARYVRKKAIADERSQK